MGREGVLARPDGSSCGLDSSRSWRPVPASQLSVLMSVLSWMGRGAGHHQAPALHRRQEGPPRVLATRCLWQSGGPGSPFRCFVLGVGMSVRGAWLGLYRRQWALPSRVRLGRRSRHPLGAPALRP